MKTALNKLLSPKEIIFISLLLLVSFLGLITFIYNTTNILKIERIVYGGRITEGVVGTPRVGNPINAHNQVDKDLNALIYSPLIQNINGDKFDLVLAERVDKSQDSLTYRVKLKDNISFQNGKPITSDDVIYSLENNFIDRSFYLEKIDDKNLNIKVKKAGEINILEKLSVGIVPKNTKSEIDFSTSLVGSGFFKIQSLSKDPSGNITNMILKRYDNGVEKLPYVESYNINFYKNDETAFLSLQNKSIDLLGGIPGKTISKIKDDSSVHIQTSDLPNNISLFMNQSNNQDLQSKELRQALSEAIDRNTLVNQVLGGYATPEKNILGENKQNKNLQDIISTLTSSSFIFKNGVLYSSTKKTAKDIGLNKPVVIKLTTIDNVEIKETANFVATEWKKIGVETNIEVVDRKNVASLVKDRSFEILLFGFSVKENNDYNAFFNSKERTYPKLNISNFANKNVDKILENLNQNKNGLTSLSQELEDNMPVIILYKPKYIFASRLLTQTLINPFLKNEEDRYLSINNWYVKTEKVLSIWKNIPFIDNLDIILN